MLGPSATMRGMSKLIYFIAAVLCISQCYADEPEPDYATDAAVSIKKIMPSIIIQLKGKVSYWEEQLGRCDEADRILIATRLGEDQTKLENYLAGTDLPEAVLIDREARKGDFGILTPEAITQVVSQSETIVSLGTYFFDVQGCDSARIAKTRKINGPLVVTGQRDFTLENGKTIQAMIVKPLDRKAVIKAYKALEKPSQEK
jgi:hypothetical protein